MSHFLSESQIPQEKKKAIVCLPFPQRSVQNQGVGSHSVDQGGFKLARVDTLSSASWALGSQTLNQHFLCPVLNTLFLVKPPKLE